MKGMSQEIIDLQFFSIVTPQLYALLPGLMQCCGAGLVKTVLHV